MGYPMGYLIGYPMGYPMGYLTGYPMGYPMGLPMGYCSPLHVALVHCSSSRSGPEEQIALIFVKDTFLPRPVQTIMIISKMAMPCFKQ